MQGNQAVLPLDTMVVRGPTSEDKNDIKTGSKNSVSESRFGNEYELNLQIDVNLLTSNYVDMN